MVTNEERWQIFLDAREGIMKLFMEGMSLKEADHEYNSRVPKERQWSITDHQVKRYLGNLYKLPRVMETYIETIRDRIKETGFAVKKEDTW
jgi:hypothetical protein